MVPVIDLASAKNVEPRIEFKYPKWDNNRNDIEES